MVSLALFVSVFASSVRSPLDSFLCASFSGASEFFICCAVSMFFVFAWCVGSGCSSQHVICFIFLFSIVMYPIFVSLWKCAFIIPFLGSNSGTFIPSSRFNSSNIRHIFIASCSHPFSCSCCILCFCSSFISCAVVIVTKDIAIINRISVLFIFCVPLFFSNKENYLNFVFYLFV